MNESTFYGSIAAAIIALYLISRTRIGKIKIPGWLTAILAFIPVALFLSLMKGKSIIIVNTAIIVLMYLLSRARIGKIKVPGWLIAILAFVLFSLFLSLMEGKLIINRSTAIIVLMYLLSRTGIGKIKIPVWIIGILALIPILLFMIVLSAPDVPLESTEATKILNDLRNLRSAASLFYDEHKKWPSPGQVASLDEYSDRPIVNATPPRYARVILLEKPSGKSSYPVDLYVGVELLPPKNGMEKVQTRLAAKTPDIAELLQEPASGDGGFVRYKSGLNVYMKVN